MSSASSNTKSHLMAANDDPSQEESSKRHLIAANDDPSQEESCATNQAPGTIKSILYESSGLDSLPGKNRCHSRPIIGSSWLLQVNWHSFFFFNDTATTEIYTLSLHDALPI